MTPIPAKIDSGLWYQYYFPDRAPGRTGGRSARRRPDEADIRAHGDGVRQPRLCRRGDPPLRHGLGLAPGYPPYEEIERKLAAQPIITVSAITLDDVTSGKRWFGDGGKVPRPSDLPSGSGRRSQPAAGSSKSVCGRSREANGSRGLTP